MATGLTPDALDTLEDEHPDTMLALQASAEWNVDRELAAATLELQVLILRALAALGGVKEKDLPKPLDIERPASWSSAKAKPPPSSPLLSGSGLAAWVRGRSR